MDFGPAVSQRQFFRFTGPPEHWLTAVKCMTWGLELSHKDKWQKIKTGDVFFIHSTGAQSSAFPNAQSGIVGMGVVGFDFSIKESNLWRYEILHKENRWPLLVPLAELYLFSELPDPSTWESPNVDNDSQTHQLIDKLVSNRVPVGEVRGFPQMGSFSSVKPDVAEQILKQSKPLHVYSGHSLRGQFVPQKNTLSEVKSADESLRHAASLRFLEEIKERLILKPYSLVKRDNDILARAEASHHSILEELIQIFRTRGYDTFSNQYVDLFAHNGSRSFLIEVKSIENRNFRTQARKGIAQLLEYDYFEVRKFALENDMRFSDQQNLLVTSQEPKDKKYIEFINSLSLGVGVVDNNKIIPIGQDFGLSSI